SGLSCFAPLARPMPPGVRRRHEGEPSLMHPEGGSWTEVRTHTPSKFSKVLHEPLAPIPLERSKFRENGSQPPPNRACHFHGTRLSSLLVFRNVGRLKWTSSWHLLQSGMLLRLRAIMIFIQSGFSLRPFLFRSARCRTWCIWICSLL